MMTDPDQIGELIANTTTGIHGDDDARARLAKRIDKAVAEASAPIWRDMDTAPKDGREVLLQVEKRAGIPSKCLVGHYMPGGHCIDDHPAISEGWYFWNGCMFDLASNPVKWCELPQTSKL